MRDIQQMIMRALQILANMTSNNQAKTTILIFTIKELGDQIIITTIQVRSLAYYHVYIVNPMWVNGRNGHIMQPCA